MPLMPGARLGPYEIGGLMGEGGMGEVYRARDPRLGRDVAIKVLAGAFAYDPDRLQRFEKEARAVATLSHPNVLAIFDVRLRTDQRDEGPPFLVTELLEGETLRERLTRGCLPLSAVVDTARQLVAGLAAAHGRGIVHRDLKPANVFLTRGGGVKILDFGLAKTTGLAGAGPFDVELTQATGTVDGTILGTVGYMAPEQVRGTAVDHRSDIFAVGALLYEMVTGRRAFKGESPADTMSLVLREQPPLPPLHDAAAPGLTRIIGRCLAKDPNDRFQSARDLGFAIETAAGVAPASGASRREPDQKSIAVLPFEDLSADRSQQPFCEGIAAEIINALGMIAGLRVISRTSAVRCREKGFDIAEIGAHLNVQTVLEGTVRTAGTRLRVTAQLVNANDGTQLWASRYDRNEGDIFEIQDEISAAIVQNLRVTLADSKAPIIKRPTDNMEAYHLYLKGRYFWERRNQQHLKLALEHFARAIAEDPDLALAHAGISDCHTVSSIFGFRSGRDVLPLAREAAGRALALDGALAEAHHSLGAVRLFLEWDWHAADVAFTRAIELNPHLAIAHLYRACLLAITGRHDESAAAAIRAVELEPDSTLITHIAGSVLYWLRRYELSRTYLDRSRALDPGGTIGQWTRCALLSQVGEHDLAIADTEAIAQALNRPSFLISRLGRAYGRAGRRSDAERILTELLNRRHTEYVAPLQIADVYAGLDDRDRALDWLESGHEERNSFLPTIALEPFYDPLRDEPRFKALLARMRLETNGKGQP